MSKHLKALSLTFSLWLCLASSASADWMPTFDPNQHVYIDPAMAASQEAPVKFEQSLIQKLSKYKQTNYYLVAIESDQYPQSSLGVAKTDDLIKAWGNLDNFPNKDYALIVWARQKENPAKGGFGKNVSPDLATGKELDIKPIIKKNMPSNPQGVFLGIIESIESDINFAYWVNVIVLSGAVIALLWIIALLLGIPEWFTRDKRAKASKSTQTNTATSNSGFWVWDFSSSNDSSSSDWGSSGSDYSDSGSSGGDY